MKAYVLGIIGASTDAGKLIKGLRTYSFVKEAYLLYGTYDLIAKVEVEKPTELSRSLVRFREEGIAGTASYIVNANHLDYESPSCKKTKKSAYLFCRVSEYIDDSFIREVLSDSTSLCEAAYVFGAYDLIFSVNEKVRDQVFRKVGIPVRKIPGIISIQTFLTLNDF